jgi:hypothetical protein
VLATTGLARAGGADPTTATEPQKQQAQAHFSKAHDLFAKRQFARALEEARASWGIVASPNARILIARCLREMGKLADAYAEYVATADDARVLAQSEARYEETAKAATDEKTSLEPQIALVTIHIGHPTDDTRVTVAGQLIARDAWSQPLPESPGSIEVIIEAGGKQVGHQSLTVAAGEQRSVDLDMSPTLGAAVPPIDPADQPDFGKRVLAETPPPTPRGRRELRTYAYIAGGVGAVGLVVFGIFGAIDDSTYSGLQSSCPANACPPSKLSEISSGRTQQLAANIGLGVGIAGVVAGATLFAISLGGKSTTADTTTALVFSPSFIGVRGAL